jgi:hypothetical protein
MTFSILVFLSGNIQQTAEQLYQSGIYKEEVEGELEKAIEIFENITLGCAMKNWGTRKPRKLTSA